MLLLVGSLALAADNGDCHPNDLVVEARYVSGVCVADELPCGSDCLKWNESEWDDFTDCGAGSEVGHRATDIGTEWRDVYDFDCDGNLVGSYHHLSMGSPWCCEGHEAWSYAAGLVNGSCRPAAEDTSAPGACEIAVAKGCSGCASTSSQWPAAAIAGLLWMLVRRPRLTPRARPPQAP